MTLRSRLARLPGALRLASISTWRNKERGLAIVSGVFLASLVVTMVFVYGSGLNQIFFQESLEGEPFDGKVEFQFSSGNETVGRTNETTVLTEACAEIEALEGVAECTIVLGRQGLRSNEFFDESFLKAQPINLIEAEDDAGNWDNMTFLYPELRDAGPPITLQRSIRFLGPNAFEDGGPQGFQARLSENIIPGQGSWPTHVNLTAERGIVVPSTVAAEADASVGDRVDVLRFHYAVDAVLLPEQIETSTCEGTIQTGENGYQYCMLTAELRNTTILGIYKPWDLGNPSLGPNPIFTSWSILDNATTRALIDADHMYLGIALDRAAIPTESTRVAGEYIEAIAALIDDGTYAELEFFYYDITGGTITFLNILLGLIQFFDYLLMVPIVVLALTVLVYGLVLSLEQRRREISIQRVIGATQPGLQRTVILEVAVMSVLAYIVGVIVALLTVETVLSSVGFLQFESSGVDVRPRLTISSLFITISSTIVLALIFGWNRTREFLALEIDEGVRKSTEQKKRRTWLHLLFFGGGLIAVLDAFVETYLGQANGLFQGFLLNGLLALFGPFFLWGGGALVLGRLGAAGPRILQFLFGRTPLVSDIRRGLKGSSSAESVNRLAVIMILTMSVITLAAIQGHTGTLVDERSATKVTGGDLRIETTERLNTTAMVDLIHESGWNASGIDVALTTSGLTTIPTMELAYANGTESVTAYVFLEDHERVLDWSDQSYPGRDLGAFVDALATVGTFTASAEVAENLGLIQSANREGTTRTLIAEADRLDPVEFTLENVTLRTNVSDNLSVEAAFFLLEVYPFEVDLSSAGLAGAQLQDFVLDRGRFVRTNFTSVNLSGANLTETLLSTVDSEALFEAPEPMFIGADLTGANLSNSVIASFIPMFAGADLSGANLTGMWDALDENGTVDLTGATVDTSTICPDGQAADAVTGCAASVTPAPPAVQDLLELFAERSYDRSEHTVPLVNIGFHDWLPGIANSEGIMIGEATYRAFVGAEPIENLNATVWYLDVGDEYKDEDELVTLAANLEAQGVVASALDYTTEHDRVERNGGLIFGTPGLLTLQFVVASIAAVASAFVFLSLVLTQRQKELAVLQAIGASPNQVTRLVLFEIMAIILVSMSLGVLLGIGLALSFNALFSVFGFIFGIFTGGATVEIGRELIWPWTQLLVICVIVLASVVLALLFTTRRALNSDLAVILKGE